MSRHNRDKRRKAQRVKPPRGRADIPTMYVRAKVVNRTNPNHQSNSKGA